LLGNHARRLPSRRFDRDAGMKRKAPDAGAAVSYLYLAIAILGEVVATSALKASDQLTRPLPSMIVMVGYAVAFYFLSLALRTLPLGIAYAIWAGAGTMLIALVGCVVFQQVLDAAAIVGIALMLVGAVIVNVWSSSGSH
jgi:small multidrug resistance pump